LNFSGNRYTREDLAGLLRQPGVVAVVMRCEDRFGTYGIVGFSIVRAAGRAVEMTDLMFSCRIQGKRIEHAYLVYLFEQSCAGGAERLVCRYRRTARNSAAARVFADLSFEREAAAGEPDRETHALVCGRGAPGRFPAEVADGMHLGRRLRELPGGGNNTAREAARPPGLERGA
jgi:predicted enzyme involved in methoxymalonyl-ACP biosynthesis